MITTQKLVSVFDHDDAEQLDFPSLVGVHKAYAKAR